MLVAFGEFAHDRGAENVADLPVHIDASISHRTVERASQRADGRNRQPSRWSVLATEENARCADRLPGTVPKNRDSTPEYASNPATREGTRGLHHQATKR